MFLLIKKSIVVIFFLVIVCCVVYPGVVWAFGQVLFKSQANGSLLEKNGEVVGSSLIGQNFQRPEYFHPRPSSAGDKGYDPMNTSGSNLTMTNKKFIDGLDANIKKVLDENPGLQKSNIPNDMVMGSASGIDPHISPENAVAQADRVAKARNIDVAKVKELIQSKTENHSLLGDPVVDVLELNLALDGTTPEK